MRVTTVFFASMFSLAMFSYIVGYYIMSTALLPEVVVLCCIGLFYLRQRSFMVTKGQVQWLGFALVSALNVVFLVVLTFGAIRGIGKESYRVFLLPSLCFAFSLHRENVNIARLLQFTVGLIKCIAIYAVFEFLFLNIFSSGNFSGHILSAAIRNYYGGFQGQYFNAVWDYGLPLFRPFGVWLQPQKSSFIFVIGISICSELLQCHGPTRHAIKLRLWQGGFFLCCVLSGGKTGVFAAVLLIVLELTKRMYLVRLMLVGAVVVGASYLIELHFKNTVGTVLHDLMAFGNVGFFSLLIGMGFVDFWYLKAQGFAVESFILRFIGSIGLVSFGLYVIWFSMLVLKTRVDFEQVLRLLVILLFMTIHYSVLSVHFSIMYVAFVLAVLIPTTPRVCVRASTMEKRPRLS